MRNKNKKTARLRRARRTRMRIREQGVPRLSVFRSPRHIYAQILSPESDRVLASASTVESQVRQALTGNTGNAEAARSIGALIAERAKSAGIEQVAFDRSGFRYHGRIAALAEAARGGGLNF